MDIDVAGVKLILPIAGVRPDEGFEVAVVDSEVVDEREVEDVEEELSSSVELVDFRFSR